VRSEVMNKLKNRLLFIMFVCASAWGQTVFSPNPYTIVGQPLLQQQGLITATAPNLVEGRELNTPQAVAVDGTANPPILYVADTVNNRVLAWKNAAGITNGAKADLVIGQRDFLSTAPQGPRNQGTTLSTGLSSPVALAVDKSGNLYVVDASNNRVLRYPSPFQQSSPLLAVDLVLGQSDLTGFQANQGQNTPTASSLAFTAGQVTLRSGLAFDAFGNLWVSDSGNNRVLRFPSTALAPGTNLPSADIVLGQTSFTTNSLPPGTNPGSKNALWQPAGLAFDPQGRLFVTDNLNRVLVYPPAAPSTSLAVRIMGVIPYTQNPTPPAVSAGTLGAMNSSGTTFPPQAVFFVGSNPFVVDTANHRILKFDSFDRWPPETISFSPVAISVLGQADFASALPNRAQAQPSAGTLNSPVGAAFFNNMLYVADSGNNRVLMLPEQSNGAFSTASSVLGQRDFPYNARNLIEGREMFFAQNGVIIGGGAAVDGSSTPPHLYVADPGNNRVLGYRDYRKLQAGLPADIVIGQPDMYTAEVNYSTNLVTPTQVGLSRPEGVAVDSNGNLYVADTGNGRVLRYSQPFNQSATALLQPNLVLGQSSFVSKVTDASAATMDQPNGLAFTSNGSLLVSDFALSRVLLFQKPAGGDFVNGQLATTVIGQPNFGPPVPGSVLSSPGAIATDANDRVYVTDTGHNRVVVFPSVPTAGNNPSPSLAVANGINGDSLNSPLGVYVNPATQELWIADTNNNRLLRYPPFQQLVLNQAANSSLPSFGPLAMTLDPMGNPISIEGSTNRVAFFSPSVDTTANAGGVPGHFSGNAASYLGRFAPGMLAVIFASPNSSFGSQTATFSTLPLPTMLGDIQVLVGGIPAPLLYVSPSQINFQVPAAIGSGGLGQQVQVIQASTGQTLAAALFGVTTVAPGLFTADGTGSGQIIAINVQDGTLNGASHPAKAGTFVQLWGTGMGLVSPQPPDGTAAQSAVPAPVSTQVFINSGFVPDGDVQFSGLAPGFVGVWVINVKVPANVPPGDVPVVVELGGVFSNLDTNGNRRLTTIRTTP